MLLKMGFLLILQWPGIEPRIERTPAHDKNGVPITRDMVAKELCARLMENLKRYPEVVYSSLI